MQAKELGLERELQTEHCVRAGLISSKPQDLHSNRSHII